MNSVQSSLYAVKHQVTFFQSLKFRKQYVVFLAMTCEEFDLDYRHLRGMPLKLFLNCILFMSNCIFPAPQQGMETRPYELAYVPLSDII